MKTFVLPVCLALATATVFAANLKDPAEVAREWDAQAAQNREPILSTGLDPLARPRTPLTYMGRAKPVARTPFSVTPPSKPRPRRDEPLYDAPNFQPPAVLPDNMPPGSKPWDYNGQKYYVIPLNPATGK